MDKFCQSCGMPLNGQDLLGSEANGTKTEEYCMYCYEGGQFKQPELTLEDMVEHCVPHMKEHGMTEAAARKLLREHLPNLKRWRK
ncbi:zinc ribbon domain-containing protein [Sporomusa sp.]|uniref:zinc ribbon domain-containing protein n=1 Tax=Sporomusa sp. TaxID=2078658 RepID=UPI002C55FFC8|nr:zinc ribbon domain-containing protein [Sporomusa sp.]HWR41675.1 zinc ribbon domain-containing protein [Sporomusa sp.]